MSTMKKLNIFVIPFVSILFLKLPLEPHSRIKYFRNEEEAINETKIYAIDFIGLVESHGRQAEWHNVTTEDGYVLSLFRIPPNPSVNNSNNNRPIFLQHGLMAAADLFIIFGNGRALPYLLSDAGYDVWLGNLRGNYYSRRHKTLSPDDSAFWDFGMDEYALQDLPAFFNYILVRTNQSTLSYVGHSLGTTLILILLSDKPEYNSKLNLVMNFAPVAYWRGWNLGRLLMAIVTFHVETSFPGGNVEYPVPSTLIPAALDSCFSTKIARSLCRTPFDVALGEDREQLDDEDSLKIARYYPAGSSAKAIQHYGQHIRSGDFRHFDYKNQHLNLEKYGQETPPEYNLTNIRTPIILFRGKNDPLSTEEMSKELIRRLPYDLDLTYEVIEYVKFTHIDFIGARDVQELLYNNVLKHLENFFQRSSKSNALH